MPYLTFEQVDQEARRLPKLRRRAVLLALGHEDRPDILSYGEAIVIWLADFMCQYSQLTQDQVSLVLEKYCCTIASSFDLEFSDALEHKERWQNVIQPKHLLISDRRVVSFIGERPIRMAEFLNLETGEIEKGFNYTPGIEVVGYNLLQLLQHNLAKIKSKRPGAVMPK